MTSAVLPSSEQNPLTSESASRAFSRLARSLTEIALHAPVDPLEETGEHVAGPDLDERRHALAG